jgi:hypothetical protein
MEEKAGADCHEANNPDCCFMHRVGFCIAAQALALGAVAVTDNVAEFSRVSGLTVENWLE